MPKTRRENLQILMKAGKAADAEGAITAKGKSAQSAYEAIRTNPDLNDDAKRRRIAEVYTSQMRGLDDKLDNMASRVYLLDRDDASWAFGIKGLPGDEASLMISRRDAGDRVADITEGTELRDLLRRATRSGDEVLARAVLEKAVEMQNSKTAHAYVKDRPEQEQRVERLWNEQRSASRSFEMTVHLMQMQPAEFAGMPHGSIVDVAESA